MPDLFEGTTGGGSSNMVGHNLIATLVGRAIGIYLFIAQNAITLVGAATSLSHIRARLPDCARNKSP